MATGSGRRRLRAEILIVLGLSLGQSAVYAVVQLIDKLTRGPLGGQTTTLNPTRSDREYLDLTYQLLGIGFSLVPVVLVLFLLAGSGFRPLRRLGVDGTRPWVDTGQGVALFAVMAGGSLALYAVGRALGITTALVPAALGTYWWTVPVLVLSGIRHALLEEIVVVGYLTLRWRQLGWSTPAILVVSALLRGSYHLYQGFGPFLGNVVMGLVFVAVYLRVRRVMPLIVAHALLDVGAFVGFALLGRATGFG
ncbi:CPBP family intramembrane glutamic endopeptidase [Tersicoccus solisilvae]|uniref:CPBP family intramembrane glutamic endopeptidase n=1 Tax=Tersicoccus solisilvae TaxID=1882339 RepID=UPI001E499236|nr:CPBP family intramembrane glutamic endopeptidase [Tersicoccus solisilvae]